MIVPAGTKELVDYGITLTAAQINDAELQANKDQPNGYAGLNADGDLVGPIILSDVTTEVLDDNAIALRGGKMTVGDGTTAGGVYLPTGLPMSDDSYVIVARDSTDIASGTNLLAAYTAAKALTPGGNALSATNRATLLIPPGRYDFGTGDGSNHGLILDTQYVDVVGLGAREDVVLTSQIATASRGTVEQTANDVLIANLTIGCEPASDARNYDDTDPAAYFPTTNLTLAKCRDAVFQSVNSNAWSMRMVIEYSGTFTNCTGGVESFGGYGTASGTFTNCVGGYYSFGGDGGTASGTFTNCVGWYYSFGGYGGTASGNFYQCRMTGVEWISTFTGVMDGCRWEVTGTNATALTVGTGAKIRNSTLIATGTGKSIDAASAVSVEISNCHTPQGISENVTNTNTSEATSFALQVSGTLATGDGQAYVTIPAKLNGMRLRRVHARVLTAGTTGTTDIQIHNVTNAVDLLSTKLTIDSGETGSDTAATPAVINHSNSLLATNDLLRIDIDAVSTTAPETLIVTLEAY